MILPADRWFFITGCQRSGTTLLRLVLECHPKVFCFDELDSYRVLSSGQFDETISKQWIGFKVPRWTEQLDYELLRDFGLAEEARRIYRGQKILFLVRDYRDVITSMLKLRGRTKSWLEEWGVPILEAHVQYEYGFAERWARELEMCRAAPNRLVAIGALYWKFKNASLLRYAERGYPVLAICYERLVTHPEEQLRRMCTFMGIDFTDELLRHPTHPHREILENGLTVGNSDPARLIETTSVGQWRGYIGPDDVAFAHEMVGTLPGLITKYFG
jgi:hypothetical protein